MYTLVNAIVKSRGFSGRWETTDLSTTPLLELWKTYSRIYLVLTNPFIEGEVSLDMALVQANMANIVQTITVATWLSGLATNSLPTSNTVPVLEFGFVKYRDVLQAGYTMDLLHRTADPSTQFPASSKKDVLLKKTGLTYTDFAKYCLVTVNGMLHYSLPRTEGIQIIDAGETLRVGNDNHIGVLSFKDVGEISTIPITPEMVSPGVPGGKLGNHVNVKLPPIDNLSNKTFLISVGGYLHYVGNIVKYVGDGILQIDINNFVLEGRFFDLKNKINVEAMTEHMTFKNGGYNQISMEELYSDEVVRAMMTLSQSFVIVVDNSDLFIEQEELNRTQTPGVYLTQTTPDYPVILDRGSMYDFWAIKENGVNVISGVNNRRTNYNYETTHVYEEPSVDNTRNTINPNIFSRAYFLKISTLKETA